MGETEGEDEALKDHERAVGRSQWLADGLGQLPSDQIRQTRKGSSEAATNMEESCGANE